MQSDAARTWCAVRIFANYGSAVLEMLIHSWDPGVRFELGMMRAQAPEPGVQSRRYGVRFASPATRTSRSR